MARKRLGKKTLEKAADYCDLKAESSNDHRYVGAHRILAALLHKRLGPETATDIFQEIAERGGLHGMNGCSGAEDSFGDFGIPEPWGEWQLPE